MPKLHRPFFCSNKNRASAIIGAVVVATIMAMAVGTMLSTANTATRRSKDKLTYEQAYQAALAGTHTARAWLIDQKLAKSMTGNNTMASDLVSIVDKATKMNQQIQLDVKSKSLKTVFGITYFKTFQLLATDASPLLDGRAVVYNFPSTQPMLSLDNSSGKPHFTYNLFTGTPTDGNKTYVEWVRLTTPGTTNETSASLRETTFIIEAKGVTEYAGVKKERIVQQRVLLKPNEPSKPLLSSAEAIITKGGSSGKAMSSNNVHWGAVLSKSDIRNQFLAPIKKVLGSGNKLIGYEIANGDNKNNMGGMGVYDSGNHHEPNGILDTRLAYKTGVNGQILTGREGKNDDFPLFKDVANVPAKQTFDFFQQYSQGKLGFTVNAATPLSTLVLGSRFTSMGTSYSSPNGLFDKTSYAGSLVQGSPAIDTQVDDFFAAADYETLKAYAKAHDTYYVFNGSTPKTPSGKSLTPMPTANLSDPLSSTAPSDQLLFVDSPAGTEASPFTGSMQLPDYWKGIVYVNGNVGVQSKGPGMTIRSPEQFMNFRAPGSVTPTPSSPVTSSFCLDGILISNGDVTFGGNGGIYGTVAAKGFVELGASGSIYYNSANGEGRMKDTSKGAQPYALIAGKLREVAVPNS